MIQSETIVSEIGDTGVKHPVVLHTRVVCGEGGGPEKTILNSPRHLAPLGYQGICAYMRPPRDPGFDYIRQRAADCSAPLVEIDDRGAWDLRVVTQLVRACRKHRVAIWHGHDYKSNAMGLLVHKFWPMSLVTTVHGWVKFTRRTPLYYGVDRFCLRHYDRVICVSADLEERCLTAGVLARKCSTLLNGIDLDQYRRTMTVEESKRKCERPADRLLIGAAGRLSEEKGFDHLIRSTDQLLNSGLDCELLIVGEGDDRARLEALIDSLGRQDRIRLAGYQTNLMDLYQAMDVFVISSLREGLPNVLLEAMALKVPVVATRVAGIPDLVRHEETGILIDPGDQQALTGALERCLHNLELRAQLATAARETVERQCSFEQRMRHIGEIYDSVLSRSRGNQR